MPATSNDPIRVLAVDDSVTIRETLSLLIEAQSDMELVGTAASGHEAVRRERTDVLELDAPCLASREVVHFAIEARQLGELAFQYELK